MKKYTSDEWKELTEEERQAYLEAKYAAKRSKK